MSNIFHTVLLLALPASGKSEVRNFMAQMEGETLQRDFHIGENLQLDDFPYVHFMRRIDEELAALGKERIYYRSNEEPFNNNYDWGTLVQLLNEDYHDLLHSNRVSPASYAEHLFDRIDAASLKVGNEARLKALPAETRSAIAGKLEKEAKEIRDFLEDQYTDSLEGRTIVIEAARGGPDGSTLPLTGAYGYQYTLSQFSDELLDNAVILYIWVTPEESRRKNNERANPDDPGSNLFHGVPMAVMLGDYGTDDMQYLREHSEKENTVTVSRDGKTWHLPIGVFDNRVDKTSFLRADKADWDAQLVADVTAAIREATDTMWSNYTPGAFHM